MSLKTRYENPFGSALDSVENDVSHIRTLVNGVTRFEITESGRLTDKEKTLIHELKPGEYQLYLQSLSNGKFEITITVKDNNATVLECESFLQGRGKYKDYVTGFTISTPGVFKITFRDKARFWQNSSFDFKLVRTGQDKPPESIKRYRIKLYFGNETQVVDITEGIKLTTLLERFKKYAVKMNADPETYCIRYVDEDDVVTIEGQEGLDIFFHSVESKKVKGKLLLDDPKKASSTQTVLNRLHESNTPIKPFDQQAIFDRRVDQHHSMNYLFTTKTDLSPPVTPYRNNRSRSIADGDRRRGNKQDRVVKKDKWQKGNAIGAGAFGTVYLGINEMNGEFIAIKEINLNSNITAETLHKLEQEIHLMSTFDNDHIVGYLGCEKTDQYLYIFLDYIPGGNIESVLADFKLTENIVRRYTAQILEGLCYLHDHDVIHRDIKSANLLVDEFGRVYLADFGCSVNVKTVMEKPQIIGTPNYVAPEVIADQNYSKAADIWSLGCTVLEMLSHKPPWYHVFDIFDHPISLMNHIRESSITKADHLVIPSDLSPVARDFLEKCLLWDHNERSTVKELMQHSFLINQPPALQILEDADHTTLTTGQKVFPMGELAAAAVTNEISDGFTFDHIGPYVSDDDDSDDEAVPMNDCQPDEFTDYYTEKKARHSVEQQGETNKLNKFITMSVAGSIPSEEDAKDLRRQSSNLTNQIRSSSNHVKKNCAFPEEKHLLRYLSKHAMENRRKIKKFLETQEFPVN
ncbi:mitogen-activated protein kinase kinase kinase [Acrasis kona]|uniref:Mitogen-activated protein kinase kinase kinase n=1 Tax=Acrasis kona TaxID=1008807 RepID=A0AAW2ZB25_9EUKA